MLADYQDAANRQHRYEAARAGDDGYKSKLFGPGMNAAKRNVAFARVELARQQRELVNDQLAVERAATRTTLVHLKARIGMVAKAEAALKAAEAKVSA